MAVFITGGHGHIASWTAYYLAKEGQEVILYDVNPAAPDYLAEVVDHISFIQGDVLDFPRLTDVFQRHRGQIEGIIHTVGIMGEIVQRNPHKHVSLNVGGTHNVLELARIFDVPKVVYTSTGAVYPAVPGIVAEDDHAPAPSDLYGATKFSSELLGQHYANTFGFEFRVCRVYFCYGPGKLPSTFVRLYQMAFGALEGMTGLNMDRGADQRLDFTYIEDAARGTALLYQAQDLQHNIFNIATGQPNSIGAVLDVVRKYARFPVQVELGPGVLMERAEALDISRARRELGYEPRFTLEEGVRRYADWMNRTLKA
jgi:nucleoside-diphosphate-sugar epimerase